MTEGTCKPGFERVAEAFKKNFDRNGEVGASVCLTVGGESRRRSVGRRRRSQDRCGVEQGHGEHRVLLHQGRHGALRPCAGEPRQARPRCAGRRAVARVRPARQGARDHAHDAGSLLGGAGPARSGEGERTLRMGLHDRAPGRRGAVLAARHAQRLSRLHLRLDGRRDGAAGLRQVARHLLPRRGRGAARPRLLDRPAGGDRAPGRADHAPHLQGGRRRDALHARSRHRQAVDRLPVLLQRRRLAHQGRQRPRIACRGDRRGQRHHQRARAGRHVCAAGEWRRPSWSTPRRSRAWARSRWPRTTTPPCASPPASRWAS